MMDHFLSIADLTGEDLHDLLDLAMDLKKARQEGGNEPLLAGKILGMIFQKPSLRTRVSFEVGMLHLGGQALYLSPNEIQLGVRESIPDAAHVLSRYVDGIMARVFAHSDIEGLAAHASVPVINGLSDFNHPCQGLADLLTIYEMRGGLAGLKLAYLGDGNNVAHSLLFGGALSGMDVAIATPRGYEPEVGAVALARHLARNSGATLDVGNDPQAAVEGADVVYTDAWASMGQEEERAERLRLFPPYQVNAALMRLARPHALVMHCLPAHRGEEITDEVIDGPQSVVFDQAENRLHAQKAVLVKLMAG